MDYFNGMEKQKYGFMILCPFVVVQIVKFLEVKMLLFFSLFSFLFCILNNRERDEKFNVVLTVKQAFRLIFEKI